MKTFRALGLLFVIGFAVWFYFGGGFDQAVDAGMHDVNQHVAADVLQQYDIAKRNGSKVDACVHAGIVAAAYIQAKDEPNYIHWKAVEKSDCRLAGLRMP